MLDNHLVESLVIALGNKGIRLLVVKTAHFVEQSEERAAAVAQVGQPMVCTGCAVRMNIKADVFTTAAVLVLVQHSHLIERTSKVGAAKWFVLVEFEAVLVVEMERPKFPECHCKGDLIGRIQAGEDAMGGLDQCSDPLGIAS